ncbi:AAA family ATPase [Candidatus Palauibacter sp.]|uniref:AAA family ATPase n=1 Tax=Candidatus Palauibacter sp. TaxID=3101350 RepID=UPI003AF23A3D
MIEHNDGDGILARVVLRNYRSIAACDVRPAPLSILVGPNGAGKSNFLDSLRFVADALRFSLEHALQSRGGIAEVRKRSASSPRHAGIRIDLRLGEALVSYAFEIAAKRKGAYAIKREACQLRPSILEPIHSYVVREGQVVRSSFPSLPSVSDRLYLVAASHLPELRPVYDALSRMTFYNFNVDAIRAPRPATPEGILFRDGANLAEIFSGLDPASREEIVSYVAAIVPAISDVDTHLVDRRQTLRFWQNAPGSDRRWKFPASAMSDGTLRVLATLVAMRQSGMIGWGAPSVVGLEEPETALHPAAAEALLEAMRGSSRSVQILATSHGADLLDNFTIPQDAILPVVTENGNTRIGPLDAAARSAIDARSFTAGELLRMDQLQPDPHWAKIEEVNLWGGIAGTV